MKVVYRQRLLPPEHVLLIDRRHYDDYAAHLGAELQQRMQKEGLFVSCYQYDADPRYCWPANRSERNFSIAQLADRHQGQHLLVIGDAVAFFRGADRRPIPLGNNMAWISKTLLSINTPDDWGNVEHKLIRSGFRITPFTRRGLLQLIDVLQPEIAEQHIDNARSLDYRDTALPSALRAYAADWLEELQPSRRQRNNVIAALKTYLGFEGYRLLSAMAAYPALDWRLTRALDAQLLQRPGEEREIRLRKLSRLPWLRGGRLPDVWRKVLIRSLDKSMLQQINSAYQALLDYQGTEVMGLPVAVPDYQAASAEQREWIDTAKPGEALNDTVFASVIRGRKPSILEFTLPRMITNWMPPQYWRGLVFPTFIALLITVGLSFILSLTWQHWIEPRQQQLAIATMRAGLAAYNINLIHDQRLQFHADILQERLLDWGFTVNRELYKADQKSIPPTDITSFTQDANRIKYAGSMPETPLELAKQRLRYLTYAAPVVELKDDAITGNEIIIRLQQAYRPLSVYSDALQPRLLKDIRQDQLKDGGYGPAMVKIPSGCFDMGSPDTYKDRDDEVPQRQVCIEKEFYIGQYEVTFDDYDRYAKAANKSLPEDRNWGRGDHPVIHVSWEDAQAYAQWVSQQTGNNYRLPTEAEWEYAARAETTTNYWWGDAVKQGMANCNGCGSRWDNQQTAVVGSFAPNAFGLHDMSGNVWEWVQDCWHDNYEGAPEDGSAWEDADKGDCGRRVLRGGSWGGFPGDVRSAYRFRDGPDDRDDGSGFRLAQD